MTTTTRYEIQTRTASTPWEREASSEDYETRAAAEADAANLEPTNDDGAAIEYRVVEIEREVAYPSDVAAEVSARRPDLAIGDSISAILTAHPHLTADEVIEGLDEATADAAADRAAEQ